MSRSWIYEGDEPVRVNKWLAQSGVCSRREAEGLIAEGLVTIDGALVEDVGRKILPGQTLTLDEVGQEALDTKLTVLIHKPVGIVSAQPEGDQVPAVRLLRRSNLFVEAEVYPNSDHRLAPLGRLDMDSRGLLILSEDGVLAKAVIGPDSELDKEYFVQVEGDITPEKIDLLRHGLELDGRELRPATVEEVMPGRLRFVLVEGRNRQIRRMCELVELEVVDLIRTRVGPIELADLPEGMWRPMTAEERAALLEASVPRPPVPSSRL